MYYMQNAPQYPEFEPAFFEKCVELVRGIDDIGTINGYQPEDEFMRSYDIVPSADIEQISIGRLIKPMQEPQSTDYFVIRSQITETQKGRVSCEVEYAVNAYVMDEIIIVNNALKDISMVRHDAPDEQEYPLATEFLKKLDRFYALTQEEQSKELIDELSALPQEERLKLRQLLIELFPPPDNIQMDDDDIDEALKLLRIITY